VIKMELPNIRMDNMTWSERHYQKCFIYGKYKFEYIGD